MIPLRGAGRDRQQNSDYTDDQSDAIRTAVTISRNSKIKTRNGLVNRLVKLGIDKEMAEWAVDHMK